MLIRADLKCYHCGHISGQIAGDTDDPIHTRTFQPAPDFRGKLPRPGQPFRCDRCAGPVFLDEVEVVRVRPPQKITNIMHPRRHYQRPVVLAAEKKSA